MHLRQLFDPDSSTYTYVLGDEASKRALLVGTCGRTDFQGGDPGTLYDSITTRLYALDEDVIVYPGHDYAGHTQTTIGRERRDNARVAGRTREQFIELMNNLHLPPPKK